MKRLSIYIIIALFVTTMPSFAYRAEKKLPDIWITPNPYSKIVDGKRHYGLCDVKKMFESPNRWPTVLDKTACIKITDDIEQYGFDNGYLKKTFKKLLEKHGIRFAIEVYPFNQKKRAFNVDEAKTYFTKAKELGFDVRYVIASGGDASILYAIRYGDFSINKAVRDFVKYEREVKKIYPKALVGEIFSFGDSTGYTKREFVEVLDTYRKITGREFSLIQIEPYGSDVEEVISMARLLDQRGITYGFILHGLIHGAEEAKSNRQWQRRVLNYAKKLLQYDIRPDHYNVQSWIHKPDTAIPETKPYTFTNTVLKFIQLMDSQTTTKINLE
ncbi:MAG: hypothetical protein GXP56_14270 [Deltaproteobacteria bacterium]|nr:hypothetical protein [Deltaproteobacteria bacterium]